MIKGTKQAGPLGLRALPAVFFAGGRPPIQTKCLQARTGKSTGPRAAQRAGQAENRPAAAAKEHPRAAARTGAFCPAVDAAVRGTLQPPQELHRAGPFRAYLGGTAEGSSPFVPYLLSGMGRKAFVLWVLRQRADFLHTKERTDTMLKRTVYCDQAGYGRHHFHRPAGPGRGTAGGV